MNINYIDAKVKLPKDLKQYAINSVLKRVIPCIVLLIGLAVFLITFGDTVFGEDNNSFKIICYVIVMLLPFFITGVPHKLIDQTYCGNIADVDQVLTWDNERSTKPSREASFTRNTIYLTIATPDGKMIHKKVYSGNVKLQQHLETYQKGDKVFHLAYTSRTVVLPKSFDTRVECCVCGRNNDVTNDTCYGCGHTLVKDFFDF